MNSLAISVEGERPRYSSEGELHFCRACPKHLNCCTRIRTGGAIIPPFVFKQEMSQILSRSGWSADRVFEKSTLGGGQEIQTLRSTEPGCIFNVGGLCGIYETRPFDCRLFPFDIHEKADGTCVWVVYTKLCPVAFDYRAYFDIAKKALAALRPTLDELLGFVRYGRNSMYEESVIELDEFVIANYTLEADRVMEKN